MVELLIGEVAELTSISAGRIRHYERSGLIQPRYRDSGYRTFCNDDVLLLLWIDLLRSIGLGLDEIRRALNDPAEVLHRHRTVLLAERAKLDEMITAVDTAMDVGGVEELARTHRFSLGFVGRPTRPMDGTALEAFQRIFVGTDASLPAVFGQLPIPEPHLHLFEQITRTEGAEDLINRLNTLTRQLVMGEADAADWVDQQLRHPLPEPLAAIIRRAAPQLADSPLLRHGVPALIDAVSPAAGRFLSTVELLASRRGALAVAVIVVPATPRCRAPS